MKHIGPDTFTKVSRGVELALYNVDYLAVTLFGLPGGERVRVTKRVYGKNKKFDGDMVISIGKPNYREREFLRLCKKAKTQPREYWVSKMRRAKAKVARATSPNSRSTKARSAK
jgi:hypothetical protein